MSAELEQEAAKELAANAPAIEHAVVSEVTKLPTKERCVAALAVGAAGLGLGLGAAAGWVSPLVGAFGMGLAGCVASVIRELCPWLRSAP